MTKLESCISWLEPFHSVLVIITRGRLLGIADYSALLVLGDYSEKYAHCVTNVIKQIIYMC